MMMSSACCNALTHNYFLLSRSITLSPQPTALQFRSPSSLRLPPIRSPPPFNQLRFRHSRLSAFSDDGSGATGGIGGDGGSDGWNSGDNESDDGGGIWSFLSCIAKKLEPMNTLASPVWWVFGFYCIVVGGQKLLEAALPLFCLALVFPILAEFYIIFSLFEYFIIFYIGMIFFVLCCINPIIAYALGIREGASEDDIRSLPMYRFRIREGASEDDIRSLPMYRFSQSNVMVMVDDNKKQFVKARTSSYNQSHISELSLHPDDSECCICLCPYVDGTELYRLPCTHHFHCACISRWLRTKASCPLCKFNIQRGNTLV